MGLTALRKRDRAMRGFLKIRCMVASSGERRDIGSNVFSYLTARIPRCSHQKEDGESATKITVSEKLSYNVAGRPARRKNSVAFARFQERDDDSAR